jgi:1-acyl-sn-glycerol-3-phosphate acyltransferase
VPVALNSGAFWPRRSLLRRPGTIIVEFLPAIEPGLPRKQFVAVLQERIETASARLIPAFYQALKNDNSLEKAST